MPLDIMRNIVEYLDIFDRTSLASTSRSLKTFVEGQKAFHFVLSLYVDDDEASITYGIEYRTTWYQKYIMYTGGAPYWKEAIQKAKAVLNYPKLHLNILKIDFNAGSPTLIAEMIDELVPNNQVHIENLYIGAYSTDSLLKMLPLFTPGYLNTIDVHIQEMDDTVMEKVAELEQWKQAKYFLMGGCEFVPVHHLYHFKEIDVCSVYLSAEDIREMKKILFTSPVFKKCNFALGYHTEKSIIKEEFGDPIPEERHTYHYPIPNSNEHFQINCFRMTEFFKNNPIALRHCIFYEYLQRKPKDEAFSDFYDIVGDDVIKKESFELWFDKFKFDEIIEPIVDMRDVFQNDKYALRTCILYESLKYKRREKNINKSFLTSYRELVYRRSISAHKNFCKAIGEDIMEYREFDFWFHRFLNGNYDSNYEVDKDKKIYELVDMPLDVMENIVEYLGIFDRMSLASTNRSFKTFVEDQKLFHPKMFLHVSEEVAFIEFGMECRFILYKRHGNCFTTKIQQGGKSLRGVPYWKQAIRDFKKVLNDPKFHLKTLEIEFYMPGLMPSILDELVDSFSHKAHVSNLFFRAPSTDSLLKILPLFQPGYLTTIELSMHEINDSVMEKVVEMEQWKHAKYFTMTKTVFRGSLHHLYHFKQFDIRYQQLTVEDVRQMKKILSKSSDFEKCSLRFKNSFDAGTIEKELGSCIEGASKRYKKIYHSPILNTTEYFEIEWKSWTREITMKRKKL
ncbi:unnamed protein product [Caenorhabditis brenneri]